MRYNLVLQNNFYYCNVQCYAQLRLSGSEVEYKNKSFFNKNDFLTFLQLRSFIKCVGVATKRTIKNGSIISQTIIVKHSGLIEV